MKERNLNEPNPKLEIGDRIILVHMDGENIPIGTKGKVVGLNQQPKFKQTDSGYGYWVEFFDSESNKFISKLTLIPEDDIWLFDKEFYEN